MKKKNDKETLFENMHKIAGMPLTEDINSYLPAELRDSYQAKLILMKIMELSNYLDNAQNDISYKMKDIAINMLQKDTQIEEETAFTDKDGINSDEISGDVENLGNLSTPAQQKAAKRINSQREFNEAFEMWFDSLGFDTDERKNKLKITTTISFVSDVLEKRGIKY